MRFEAVGFLMWGKIANQFAIPANQHHSPVCSISASSADSFVLAS
jgi:hypothetical protein